MTVENIIGNLRVMLHREDVTQDEIDTICAAIRALGGQP